MTVLSVSSWEMSGGDHSDTTKTHNLKYEEGRANIYNNNVHFVRKIYIKHSSIYLFVERLHLHFYYLIMRHFKWHINKTKLPQPILIWLSTSTGKNLRENAGNKYKVDWVRCENVLSPHAVKVPAAYCDLWGRLPDKNRIWTCRKTTFRLLCPSAHHVAANFKPRNNEINDIWCFTSVTSIATRLCHFLTHTQKNTDIVYFSTFLHTTAQHIRQKR